MNTHLELPDVDLRASGLAKHLLTDAEDQVLQDIVREVARELGTPIALVNILSEDIQFFKAHWGLHQELLDTRATSRNVSFCQFVQNQEGYFKIEDASKSEKVPQFLVNNYKVKSYLGVPLRVKNHLVGSLCVIDKKARKFSNKDIHELHTFSKKVISRLEELVNDMSVRKSSLVMGSAKPAVGEVTNTFGTIKSIQTELDGAVASIGTYLNMTERVFIKKKETPKSVKNLFQACRSAFKRLDSRLCDLELAMEDAFDSLTAVNGLLSSHSEAKISQIITSGRELSRSHFQKMGGVRLSEIEKDATVKVSLSMGIAFVSNAISLVANHMEEVENTDGIKINLLANKNQVKLELVNKSLSWENSAELSQRLQLIASHEENLNVGEQIEAGKIVLLFNK